MLSRPPKTMGFLYYRNTTFMALLFGYAAYYLCRQNYSLAYLPMSRDAHLHFDKISYGTIASIGTLCYAFGKFTTGGIADLKGGRFSFLIGLFVSAAACVGFGFGNSFYFFLVFWCVSRFIQSMGWSGLVNIIAHWFPVSSYGTAMGVMSLNYQFGGVIATFLTGFLISYGFGWRSLFIIPGVVLACFGLILFPLIKKSPESLGFEAILDPNAGKEPVLAQENLPAAKQGYFKTILSVFKDRGFILICILSFILTFLRECFNLWVPVLFAEYGSSISVAAMKSAVFPALGCLGTLFSGWVSDRFLNSRRTPIMAMMLLSLVILLALFSQIRGISLWLNTSPQLLAVFFIGMIGFFLLGPYSMVGGVLAMDFGGKKSAGAASGILDGVGYLGASVAGIGVAKLVEFKSWSYLFLIMAILSFLCFMICCFSWNKKAKITT